MQDRRFRKHYDFKIIFFFLLLIVSFEDRFRFPVFLKKYLNIKFYNFWCGYFKKRKGSKKSVKKQ